MLIFLLSIAETHTRTSQEGKAAQTTSERLHQQDSRYTSPLESRAVAF